MCTYRKVISFFISVSWNIKRNELFTSRRSSSQHQNLIQETEKCIVTVTLSYCGVTAKQATAMKKVLNVKVNWPKNGWKQETWLTVTASSLSSEYIFCLDANQEDRISDLVHILNAIRPEINTATILFRRVGFMAEKFLFKISCLYLHKFSVSGVISTLLTLFGTTFTINTW